MSKIDAALALECRARVPKATDRLRTFGQASKRFPIPHELREAWCVLFEAGRQTCNLLVQRSNGRAQALWDHFRVVLERSLGIGMPKMTLHILDRGVILNVR